jgi:hypothetical protein
MVRCLYFPMSCGFLGMRAGRSPLRPSGPEIAHGTAYSPCIAIRRRRRPSPYIMGVGSHVITFEALSAFTRATACQPAAPPRGTCVSKTPTAWLAPPPLRLLPAGARAGLAAAGITLPFNGAHIKKSNIMIMRKSGTRYGAAWYPSVSSGTFQKADERAHRNCYDSGKYDRPAVST